MKLLPGGIAIIERDTHYGKWIADQGSLIFESDRPMFAPFLKWGDTVIDVGANMGTHSALFCDMVGMFGTVYAFEPNPEAFSCLAINCPRAKCFMIAVGSKDCRCDVICDTNNIGSAYLKDSQNGTALCSSLDAMLPGVSPALMKIDCEGMECDVLDGAVQMINRSSPVLHVEYNRITLERNGKTVEQLRDKLFALGYKELWRSADVSEIMSDVILSRDK